MDHTEIANVLQELLFFRKGKIEDTKRFELLKHDKDLIPKFGDKIDYILKMLSRNIAISCEVQGTNDHGIDFIVRIDQDSDLKFIGFQIKAHDELAKKGVVPIIKSQFTDSYNHYVNSLLRYYILPFGNYSNRSVRKRINYVTSDFLRNHQVQVVDPRHLAGFLQLENFRIDSYMINRYSSDNYVYRCARKNIENLKPAEILVLLYLVANFVENHSAEVNVQDLLDDHYIQETLQDLGANENELFNTLPVMDGSFTEIEEEQIKLKLSAATENLAMAFDVFVRYRVERGQLFAYLVEDCRHLLEKSEEEDDY